MPDAEVTLQLSLERYLRHVSIERGLSPNTVAAYRRDLTAYLQVLHEREATLPTEVTTADVTAFARQLASREGGPLTASSTARMLSSVRGFHRYLLEEGQVPVDVAADTKPPKLPSRLPKAITIEQMASVLAATDGDEVQNLRDKALLELLYATGARISEAVALNVDDVFDGEVVRLFGKGSKQRIVPLGSFARTAIDAYLVRARPEARRARGVHAGAVPRRARKPAVAAERVAHHPRRGRTGEARDSRFRRTPSGTPSPPTCWPGEPTCGSCRSCSGIPRSRPRRFTRSSPPTRSATCTRRRIRGPDRVSVRANSQLSGAFRAACGTLLRVVSLGRLRG